MPNNNNNSLKKNNNSSKNIKNTNSPKKKQGALATLLPPQNKPRQNKPAKHKPGALRKLYGNSRPVNNKRVTNTRNLESSTAHAAISYLLNNHYANLK